MDERTLFTVHVTAISAEGFFRQMIGVSVRVKCVTRKGTPYELLGQVKLAGESFLELEGNQITHYDEIKEVTI